MAYGTLPDNYTNGTKIVYDVVTTTTTTATPATAYTFSPATNSSWNVVVDYTAVESTGFVEAAAGSLTLGFRRAAVAPVLISGTGILSYGVIEDFIPNVAITLLISGNNVLLQLDSGGVQNVRWLLNLKIIKNE